MYYIYYISYYNPSRYYVAILRVYVVLHPYYSGRNQK